MINDWSLTSVKYMGLVMYFFLVKSFRAHPIRIRSENHIRSTPLLWTEKYLHIRRHTLEKNRRKNARFGVQAGWSAPGGAKHQNC